MATLSTEYLEIPGPATKIRALVARPVAGPVAGPVARPVARSVAGGIYPVVVAWSDIFQLTPSHVRMVQRLASRGFVVVAPEIYSRIEPMGTVLDFEDDRQRALDDSAKVELAWVDAERRAVLDFAKSLPAVRAGGVATCGWCFGGHLAFRSALEPDVLASACFYATGVHDGNLGAAKGTADTLARAPEIRGELFLVWGTLDPHIPVAGRQAIHTALEHAGVRWEARLFDAAHAFMRDEGPRWDPEAADRAFEEMIALFRRRLG